MNAILFWLAASWHFHLDSFNGEMFRYRPGVGRDGRPRIGFPSHGPQVWARWHLFSVRVYECNTDIEGDRYARSWNIWLYTRWGAHCSSWVVKHKGWVWNRKLGWGRK